MYNFYKKKLISNNCELIIIQENQNIADKYILYLKFGVIN